ncbi:MAG: hypothetical protein H6734_23200 [Alphaproteobacteria bacterium]|nr:hypothetical protein [Alphaproteobacteria bacterium]
MRVPFLAALALAGCPGEPEPTGLVWYTTCGDPVCNGYGGPYDGVPACGTSTEGAACTEAGAECDFESDCNALLVCAADDPKDQPGGCPISKKAVKRDIAYLDGADLKAAADQALAMKLARWQYTWDEPGARPHLGFLIDDAPTSAAVRADGERVDLYGYTSLTLAAIQVQQAQIEALRAEVAALRETCGKP